MDKIVKSERDPELVTSLSSGYKTGSEKFRKLVVFYLTKFDDVI